MVGSAGNAPVRHFRLCFLTPDLQSGSRIASLEIGSGSGSHTHLKKFMRLLSVHWSSFPQLKLACRAVARSSGPMKPACVLGGLRRGSLHPPLCSGRRLVESVGNAPI